MASDLLILIREKDDTIEQLTRENERLRMQSLGATNQDEELLDVRQAAALLSMSEQGLRALSRDGSIPSARKVGGVWRYSRVALVAWRG